MTIGTTNVFESAENRLIFKRLLLLMVIFVVMQLIRGSERFGSIVDVEPCSFTYWFVELLMFATVYAFGRWHIKVVRSWQ